MKVFFSAIGSIVTQAFMTLAILISFIAVLTGFGSIGLFSTQSGSMLPRYPVHALLVTVPTDIETISVGDVVMVKQEATGDNVFHRVTEITDTLVEGDVVYTSLDGGDTVERIKIKEDTPVSEFWSNAGLEAGPADVAIKMWGDANPSPDGETYLVKSQVWTPLLQIPFAGKVMDIATNPTTLYWVFGIAGFIVLVVLFIPTRKEQGDTSPDSVSNRDDGADDTQSVADGDTFMDAETAQAPQGSGDRFNLLTLPPTLITPDTDAHSDGDDAITRLVFNKEQTPQETH